MRPFKLIPLGFLALLAAPAAHRRRRRSPVRDGGRVLRHRHPPLLHDGGPDGAAGPGHRTFESPRVRTGLQFDALPADVDTCETRSSGQVVCAVSIVRFNYASHDWFFYSPKPTEWAQLNAPDSGFIDRGVAFKAFLPDGPGGTCTQGRVAVYRSYRNQNHRFPADQATHQRMVTTGSEDEGITFCAEGARINPLFDAAFLAEARGGTRTEAECAPGGVHREAAWSTRNLQTPALLRGRLLAGGGSASLRRAKRLQRPLHLHGGRRAT